MPPGVPNLDDIHRRVLETFKNRPCRWQCLVAQSILTQRDVIINVGTGMGKTLSFFIPILFQNKGIHIIITPLNVLGKQNADYLNNAGISAIAISSETATPANFQVQCPLSVFCHTC